jgi:hypothetical protein
MLTHRPLFSGFHNNSVGMLLDCFASFLEVFALSKKQLAFIGLLGIYLEFEPRFYEKVHLLTIVVGVDLRSSIASTIDE